MRLLLPNYQRWAQIALYQKRSATNRNNLSDHKAQRKMRNLCFCIFEAQRNFRNKIFDSVEAQRNFAIAERHYCAKLKRNLISAIEISQNNAHTAFFAIFDRKRTRRPTFINITIEMEQS